eukprot:12660769-Heterocapsa_arctica.AAC.1
MSAPEGQAWLARHMRAERESEEAHFPVEESAGRRSYLGQRARRQADREQRRIAERTLELEQLRDAGLASDPAVALGLELHLARDSSSLLDYQSVRRETGAYLETLRSRSVQNLGDYAMSRATPWQTSRPAGREVCRTLEQPETATPRTLARSPKAKAKATPGGNQRLTPRWRARTGVVSSGSTSEMRCLIRASTCPSRASGGCRSLQARNGPRWRSGQTRPISTQRMMYDQNSQTARSGRKKNEKPTESA